MLVFIMFIFISYSSKNRDLVQTLADDLDDLNTRVWFDRELTGGRDWWADILERIRQCDVFLFALTPQSLESYPCQLEYKYAHALNKRMLPIILQDVKMSILPPALQALQAVDYRQQSKDQLKLLRKALQSLPSAPPLPEQLPIEPSAPLSPLAIVLDRLTSPSLSGDEQRLLVLDLEELLEIPEYVDDVKNGLQQLLKRDDLLMRTATRIHKLLDSDSAPQIPQSTPQTLISDPPKSAATVMTSPLSKINPIVIGHPAGAILTVACSPRANFIVTGGTDKIVRLWQANNGQLIGQLLGHTKRITSVACSPTKDVLASGSDDSTVRFWNLTTGQEIGKLTGHTAGVECIAFSPDGETLLTGGVDGTTRLWNTTTYQETARLTENLLPISCCAFLPDGNRVITDGYRRNAILWNLATSTIEAEFIGHTAGILSVGVSPLGNYVVTGSADDTARIWDSVTHAEIRQFIGHQDDVNSVAFSPTTSHILTGSLDGTARLWNIGDGKEVRQFVGHSNKVLSVAYLPDGSGVITGSADGTARIWSL